MWHYGRAYKNIINLWMNIFWFEYHFFSIGILGSTLFSPFRRIREEYVGGRGPSEFFASLAVNIIMRIVGAIIKTFIIVVGLFGMAVVLAVGIILLVIWTFMPMILIVMLFNGVLIAFF